MSEDLTKEQRKQLLSEIMKLDQENGLYDEPFDNQLVREKLKDTNYHKFDGIAPDGFVLVPVEVIELLDDFEEWKDFKYRKFEWLIEKSKSQLRVK